MTCQHAKQFPGLIHCQLIGRGFSAADAPCERCQSEWVDGDPPTRTNLPPVLVEISHGRLPVQRPADAKPLTPVEKLAAFARAFAAWLRVGGKTLAKVDAAARLAVCDGCDKRSTLLTIQICGVCGCSLHLKSKWPQQHCPLGKWPGDKSDCGPCG